MFRTRRAIISPVWTLSCQGSRWLMTTRSLPPIPRTVSGFGRTDRTQSLNPTALSELPRGEWWGMEDSRSLTELTQGSFTPQIR